MVRSLTVEQRRTQTRPVRGVVLFRGSAQSGFLETTLDARRFAEGRSRLVWGHNSLPFIAEVESWRQRRVGIETTVRGLIMVLGGAQIRRGLEGLSLRGINSEDCFTDLTSSSDDLQWIRGIYCPFLSRLSISACYKLQHNWHIWQGCESMRQHFCPR